MRTVSTSVSLICSNPIVSEGLKSILYDEEFSVVGLHKTCSAMISAKDHAAVPVGMIVFDADASRNIAEDVHAVRQAFPDSRLVVLHEGLEVDCLVDVFEAGADGYILNVQQRRAEILDRNSPGRGPELDSAQSSPPQRLASAPDATPVSGRRTLSH